MSDEPTTSVIELRPTHLVVCPGLDFDEWLKAWESLDQTSRSINWLVGDCLAYAEEAYPDRWTQAVEAQYAEQYRRALWVSSRIPPAERRAALSWSAHRAAAALEGAERTTLLDMAEANGWGSREIVEEIKRRKRPGNGGPPLSEDDDTAIEEACSTWNDPAPDPILPDIFGDVEEVTGEPLQAPPAPETPPPPPDAPATASLAPAPAASPEIATMRQCIADLRALAPKLLRTPADHIVRLEDRITDALGLEPGEMSLLNTEVILKQLPKDWSYAVTLTKPGEQIAVGLGPSLACAVAEAIISAKLSDMGAG